MSEINMGRKFYIYLRYSYSLTSVICVCNHRELLLNILIKFLCIFMFVRYGTVRYINDIVNHFTGRLSFYVDTSFKSQRLIFVCIIMLREMWKTMSELLQKCFLLRHVFIPTEICLEIGISHIVFHPVRMGS